MTTIAPSIMSLLQSSSIPLVIFPSLLPSSLFLHASTALFSKSLRPNRLCIDKAIAYAFPLRHGVRVLPLRTISRSTSSWCGVAVTAPGITPRSGSRCLSRKLSHPSFKFYSSILTHRVRGLSAAIARAIQALLLMHPC